MLTDTPIVTSGVDSEYILEGVCKYLRESGFDVYELDFSIFRDDPIPLLKKLKNNAIYITSAHTNLSCASANILAPEFPKLYPNYLSPIEIIPILNPKLSIYIPHDLLTPYGDVNLSEMRILDLFDHILVPSLADKKILESVLPPSTQIHYSGWVKHTKETTILTKQKNFPRLLFITMIGYLRARYGISGIIDYFRPILTPETYVKLPAWKDIELIEDAIRAETPAHVIPASENSTHLIQQAELVICNSASSIHCEANLMRKPTVCLLDDEGVSSAYQREKLQHLDTIYFHDYSQREPLYSSTVEELKQNLSQNSNVTFKPFSYQEVLELFNDPVSKNRTPTLCNHFELA